MEKRHAHFSQIWHLNAKFFHFEKFANYVFYIDRDVGKKFWELAKRDASTAVIYYVQAPQIFT